MTKETLRVFPKVPNEKIKFSNMVNKSKKKRVDI